MIILSWLGSGGKLCYQSSAEGDFATIEEALKEYDVVTGTIGNSHVRLWVSFPNPHVIKQTEDLHA